MTEPTPFRRHAYALLSVAGSEAGAFLDRLLTVTVSDLAPGGARYGALLTPQGKIQHELFVLRDAADFVLALPAGDLAAKLSQRLTLMKLRADVAITDSTAERAVLGARGDASPTSLAAALWARDPRLSAGGQWLGLAPAETAAECDDADDAADLRAGLPAQGRDYAPESVFPTDVNMDLLAGVDYRKGCFVGQEVASRMKRRGSIRKRTLVLTLEGADAVPSGADVTTAQGVRVGETLSSAGGVGLAIVRLDRLAAAGGLDAPLAVGDIAATASFPDYVPQEARVLTTDDAPA